MRRSGPAPILRRPVFHTQPTAAEIKRPAFPRAALRRSPGQFALFGFISISIA